MCVCVCKEREGEGVGPRCTEGVGPKVYGRGWGQLYRGGRGRGRVYLLHTAELEGRSLKEAHGMVLPCRHHTEGPHGTVVDGVDGLAVSRYLSNRRSRVPQDDVSKPEQWRRGW